MLNKDIILFVKELIEKYGQLSPEDKITIMGGAASYIWIKNKLDQEIFIKDVDIHINTKNTCKDVVDLFVDLLPGYTITNEDREIITFGDPVGNNISFDIFVNQMPDIKHSFIDTLPVELLSELILSYKNEYEGLQQDMIYLQDPNNQEYIYIKDKAERVKERLSLLSQIQSI